MGDILDVGGGADVDLLPPGGQDDGVGDESEGGRGGPRAGSVTGHPTAEGGVEEDGLDEELREVGPVQDGGRQGEGEWGGRGGGGSWTFGMVRRTG